MCMCVRVWHTRREQSARKQVDGQERTCVLVRPGGAALPPQLLPTAFVAPCLPFGASPSGAAAGASAFIAERKLIMDSSSGGAGARCFLPNARGEDLFTTV